MLHSNINANKVKTFSQKQKSWDESDTMTTSNFDEKKNENNDFNHTRFDRKNETKW